MHRLNSQAGALLAGYSFLLLLLRRGRMKLVCCTHIGSSLRIGLVPESGDTAGAVRSAACGPAGISGPGGLRCGILMLDLLAPRNHR
jgi:hypothetical protein